MLKEIWRTVCLMSFASRIYQDEAGNIYLLETRGWRKIPDHYWRIPDASTLDLLMRETCWAGTHAMIVAWSGLAAFALMRFTEIHVAWGLFILPPVFVLLWIGNRGIKHALEGCQRFPSRESELVLTRAAELAMLDWVTFVRVCAGFSPFLALWVVSAFNRYVDDFALLMIAFIWVAMASWELIAAGSRVLSPGRLNLGYEYRRSV
jgi:hypothetical protein